MKILSHHNLFKRTQYLVLTILLSCSGLIASAQESPEFLNYKTKYPDEYLARIISEQSIDISVEEGQIKISQKIDEEDLLLNDSAKFATEESVQYSSFSLLGDIEASTLAYEGGKYKEYKVEDFVRKDEISESFYDDTKSVNFLYPKLGKGAKKKLSYTRTITNPRFLSPVYFGNAFPLVKQKFEITVDKEISLRFEKFNLEGVDVRFRESKKKGRKVYTWEIENQEAFELESNGPSPQSILPHIIPIISSYTVNGEEIPVLNDVGDLYTWYYSLVKDINQEEVDTELAKITQDLIATKENEIDKVKAIYYWVQENIKYIAFEYALGGFIPRDANNVFKKKFGDCKDNSSILKEMFKIAKLDGRLTWIGTRSIPYTYTEVPTPAVDNHMILSWETDGEIYFLDATGRFLPLEFPSSFIQGKEALVENGEGDYKIVTVPIIEGSQNGFNDVLQLKLDGNSVQGKGTLSLTGYQKSDVFNNLERIDTKEKLTEYYNSLLRKGTNRFSIDSFEEKNKFSYEKPFEVAYNFTIKDYVQTLEDEIFVNLNVNQNSINSYKIEDDRKTSKEYRYKSEDSITVVFEIPEGKKVTYLPENVQIDNDFMSASITYELKDNMITYVHSYKTKSLILEKATQESFNKSLKKIKKAFKEVVVLK